MAELKMTEKELTVAKLILAGLTGVQIAERIGCARKGLHPTQRRIAARLGSQDTTLVGVREALRRIDLSTVRVLTTAEVYASGFRSAPQTEQMRLARVAAAERNRIANDLRPTRPDVVWPDFSANTATFAPHARQYVSQDIRLRSEGGE